MNLYSDVECIKGIGPKTKKILNYCGIFNIIDLLLYFPRDYERVEINNNISTAYNGRKIITRCIAVRIDRDIRTKNNKIMSTVVFKTDSGIVKGRWFSQPYMKEKFIVSNEYFILGKIQKFNGQNIIVNPTIVNNMSGNALNMISTTSTGNKYKVVPRYPLKEGLTNNLLIKLISQVLNEVIIIENLPLELLKRYKFCSLDKAIRAIHKPSSMEDLLEAKKRLKFQELFTYSLKILMLKDFMSSNKSGIAFSMSPNLKILKENLPFQLTKAQSKVIREILMNQKSAKQMNRLVQGDVGSGKTIVAIIAMFNVSENGYQAAMMAPTEILANQHYLEITNILKDFNLNIKLLSGSMSQKNKDTIKENLKNGKIDILVGTHALIEEDVQFKNLGIVVTDEQHRFGVMQRSSLFNKGKNVDILVMTATPIPRTLTLYLYGDLDVSIIDELPPGRQKIKTFYVDKKKKDKVYSFALEEMKKGRQIYVVCPLVEENEEMNIISVEEHYNDLVKNYFSETDVAVLHGKMPSKMKDEIMEKFKKNEIKVLVSTTVIEVGINVPNATVMIIENAERFGLAQLHQLRGRVGRGKFESYCILVADIKNDIVKRRLETIQNSNDGFKIAEEDLKIRGSGEVFGFRQHGEDNLILADVIEDIDLFREANFEAKKLLLSKNKEDIKVKNEILKNIKQSSRLICFN